MYHHVHGPGAPWTEGLHGPTADEFRHQLETVRRSYELIDHESLSAFLAGRADLPRRCALVTFDDGTRDQLANAVPVLRDLGVSALFFVITDTVESRQLSGVHARHLITRSIGPRGLRAEFHRAWAASCRKGDEGGSIGGDVPEDVARRAYRWDDLETARFKYAVNFALPAERRDQVLRELFEEHVGSWTEWGDRFYLSWDELRELRQHGMVVGGHSHRHEALGMLDEDAMRRDVAECRRQLRARLGEEPVPFSYPFGKSEHFSEAVIAAVRESGFSVAFTNIQGRNIFTDHPNPRDRYRLARIDPKDLMTYCE